MLEIETTEEYDLWMSRLRDLRAKQHITRYFERQQLGSVITGDITQVDLPRGVRSGLAQAADVLGDVKGISVVRFDAEDVVRHPLVGAIVKAYEKALAREKAEQKDRGGRAERRRHAEEEDNEQA